MAYLEGKEYEVFKFKEQQKILVFRRLYADVKILLRTCNWKLVGLEMNLLYVQTGMCNRIVSIISSLGRIVCLGQNGR